MSWVTPPAAPPKRGKLTRPPRRWETSAARGLTCAAWEGEALHSSGDIERPQDRPGAGVPQPERRVQGRGENLAWKGRVPHDRRALSSVPIELRDWKCRRGAAGSAEKASGRAASRSSRRCLEDRWRHSARQAGRAPVRPNHRPRARVQPLPVGAEAPAPVCERASHQPRARLRASARRILRRRRHPRRPRRPRRRLCERLPLVGLPGEESWRRRAFRVLALAAAEPDNVPLAQGGPHASPPQHRKRESATRRRSPTMPATMLSATSAQVRRAVRKYGHLSQAEEEKAITSFSGPACSSGAPALGAERASRGYSIRRCQLGSGLLGRRLLAVVSAS